MEKHAFALLQLLASMMCVSGLVTTGTPDSRLPGKLHCNESLMLERLPVCGKRFEDMMRTLGAQKWCNLTEFIVDAGNLFHIMGPIQQEISADI
ncbi:receptor activity-modifying protein 3 isoform X2 [Ambystoma mexicanum]|uniref:receptor activity-modifying protein 3 isoform X2 n=1 Tax=Ambystoma mexicanum TaxID=8296 RepID=UPI0037E830B8